MKTSWKPPLYKHNVLKIITGYKITIETESSDVKKLFKSEASKNEEPIKKEVNNFTLKKCISILPFKIRKIGATKIFLPFFD